MFVNDRSEEVVRRDVLHALILGRTNGGGVATVGYSV